MGNLSITEQIAGEIDNEGLWYWIWQKFYRRYANKISPELLNKLIGLADDMEEVRKLLQDNDYLF